MNSEYPQGFERILNLISEQVLCLDLEQRIYWVNEEVKQAVPLERLKLHTIHCYEALMKRDRPCESCPFEQVKSTRQQQMAEIQNEEGRNYWIRLFPITDEEGELLHIVELPIDMTEKRKSEAELMLRNQELRETNTILREKEEYLNLALSVAQAGFWEWDLKNNQFYFDESWLNLLGYLSREEVNHAEMVHPEDHLKILKNCNEHLRGGTPYYQCEYRLRTKDGEWKWFLTRGKVVNYDSTGHPVRMIGITQDTTEHKTVENRLKEIAYYDMLTKLPNHSYVKEHIQGAIERGSSLAILFIDLDRFKRVNDTLGHKVGDQILQCVVQRMREIRWENMMIGRIGGDEFALVVENYADKDQLRALATNLLQTFSRPFVTPENTIHLSASIGISVYPEDGIDAETLLRNAGIAMDYIKYNMGDNFSFYTKQLSDTLARKLYFETEIRKAVVNNEFVLYYQPQIHLHTGEMIGVEALIRWNHPTLGFISPGEFIPVAEETGLINLVGQWALRTACEQHRIWRDAGFSVGRMAVNVSIYQFQSEDFYETVCQVLKETEMNPQYLELEITESVVKNVKQLSDVLFRLRRLGVKIAVDDFGTGYSSLNLLHSLPLDTLKIDRSFIAELCNPSSQSLVKTMVDIGRNLQFDVIAEGVEVEEQIQFLTEAACPIAQGFYYSKPLPSGEIRKHFERYEVSGF